MTKTVPLSGSKMTALLSAAAISGLGDGLIPAAFAIQAHRLDDSGRGLTAVLLALWGGRFLSSLLVRKLPPPKYPARWMLRADCVRMLAQFLLLVWAHASGAGYSIVALAVSSACYGLASSFFGPGRFSLISTIFTADERQKVNGSLSIIGDISFVIGPVVGTWLMVWQGFDVVLSLDALTFLIGIVLLLQFYRVAITSANAEEEGEPTEKDTTSSQPASAKPHRAHSLPRWVSAGMLTWFAVSLTIGYLGSAAPTFIMNRFNESSWGWIAMGMAIGSLAGSSASMTSVFTTVIWNRKQGAACLMLIAQVTSLVFAPQLALIIGASFVGSALTTYTGVTWDLLGQAFPDPALVHTFATRDQLVNTTAIPCGMLLVAVSAGIPMLGVSVVLAALTIGVLACAVPALWKGIANLTPR